MDKAVSNLDRVIIGIDPGTNMMGYAILGICGNKPHMVAMGVIELDKIGDHYTRLGRIYQRVTMLVEQYCPDEMAIEAPFFGKNVQSMLKLGRAQGVAIAAAISRQVPIAEYEPRSSTVPMPWVPLYATTMKARVPSCQKVRHRGRNSQQGIPTESRASEHIFHNITES